MKPFFWIIIFISFIGYEGLAFVNKAKEQNIILAVGTSTKVPIHAKQLVKVSSGKLIEIQDHQNYLIITGKKLGQGTLTIGTEERNVQVVSPLLHRQYDLLNKFCKKTSLSVMGEKIYATQSEFQLDEYLDLTEVAKKHQIEFQFSAELHEADALLVRKYILNQISKSKLVSPQLSLQQNFKAYLPKELKDKLTVYSHILSPLGVEAMIDSQTVEIAPMVEVEILVAEIKRKSFQKLGLSWPNTLEIPLSGADVLAKASSASLALQALEEKGYGKILASPKLLCRHNKEAEFLAGGEFPIKIVNFKINDVIWKKHGVLLKLLPQVDQSGRMSLAITAEVSMIDDSQNVDGIPGLLTNKVQTHIDLTSSKTIALSGLIREDWGRAQSGIPGLMKIPILGKLFSSEDYRQNKSELVIFVTPKVVFPDQISSVTGLPKDFYGGSSHAAE